MGERPIWLIGCGNMAGAMLDGWLASGMATQDFRVVRPSGKAAARDVPVQRELPGTLFGDAIVQIGFKPYHLAEEAPKLAPLIGPDTHIVSILAGVELATLRKAFPDAGSIVRAMPNTPVALNAGVVGLLAEDRNAVGADAVEALMGRLGLAEWLDDEALFNVVTALAGSGPAFLFRYIDAMARAGAALGLDPAQSERMAIATVEGAARLAARSDEDPGTLADRVASPGGSTRKGLDVLDADGALDALARATLEAATRRNEEMAEEAR
ncbi:pyrroline-5-carboxylate reductase [uncultured Parasphingopyxis sp.]|uniref:pyrroline-5-carboxylate reductase n=1 Tax=uncultured Parasphingopyxis sp. TaxID=1547918 RepID=UPI00262267D9|nr:pyrroline-5-carboxylate reductase [uncultured Parasphingopyxis sp.]